MASRKAVSTIVKKEETKVSKKKNKKVVENVDPIPSSNDVNQQVLVDDEKQNPAKSKKTRKTKNIAEDVNQIVVVNDIKEDEEVVEKEITFIDKVAEEPSKKVNSKIKKNKKQLKTKPEVVNNRILINRGLSSKMVEDRVSKGYVNKTKRSNTVNIQRIRSPHAPISDTINCFTRNIVRSKSF